MMKHNILAFCTFIAFFAGFSANSMAQSTTTWEYESTYFDDVSNTEPVFSGHRAHELIGTRAGVAFDFGAGLQALDGHAFLMLMGEVGYRVHKFFGVYGELDYGFSGSGLEPRHALAFMAVPKFHYNYGAFQLSIGLGVGYRYLYERAYSEGVRTGSIRYGEHDDIYDYVKQHAFIVKPSLALEWFALSGGFAGFVLEVPCEVGTRGEDHRYQYDFYVSNGNRGHIITNKHKDFSMNSEGFDLYFHAGYKF